MIILKQPIETKPKQKLTKKELLIKVLACLLPYRQYRTVSDIAHYLELPESLVQKVIQDAFEKGHVVERDGLLHLDEEIVSVIGTLENIQRDLEDSQYFDKYSQNKILEANIQKGDAFDIATAPESAGAFLFKTTVTPHQIAYCFENTVFHVWGEGPRRGELFWTQNKIPKDQLGPYVSPSEFNQNMGELLKKMDAAYYKSDVSQEIMEYVYKVVYGLPAQELGWESLRFYDLGGDENEIDRIMQLMVIKGLKALLSDLATQQGLVLKEYDFSMQQGLENSLYFQMTSSERPFNVWRNEQEPIIFTHNTYSNVLPLVVQLGGLASKNYAESLGIQKYYGGEGGGSGAYTPNDISLWYHRNEFFPLSAGHGPQRAFEYPISFGISSEFGENLQVDWGTMRGSEEAVVPQFIPLEYISHIFVPPFKVDEVKSLFEQNNISHIKVVSLNQLDAGNST